MSRRLNLHRHQGFTLIELLAATALLALVAIMAFGGLSGLSIARDRIQTTLADTSDVQRAIWRIQDDFTQLRTRAIRDDFGDIQPAFVGSEEQGLVFTRGGQRNPLQIPVSSLSRVAYVVEDGQLLRRTWPTLDRAQETDPRDSVIIDDVSDLNWRYMDTTREWQESWPPLGVGEQDNPPPPLAVELNFDSESLGNITLVFRIMASV